MKWLRKSFLVLSILSVFLVLFSANAVEAQDTAPVFTIEIRDDIKAGTVLDIQRAISQAESADASYLIIQLDTPGGLLQSTRTIVESMQRSSVPIVVFVDQPGGWAFSAGTIILLAADVAAVHPSASIGAAQPFTPEGGNEVQDEKAVEATISWVRGLAEDKDRSPDLAERFVSENLTLRGNDALEQNAIDSTAESLEALLVELDVAENERVELTPSVTARVLNILSSPFLVSLFLTLGSLAILLAIRSGEFEFSAAIGIILLLIGLWGIGVVEFTVLGVGLLLLGAVLVMIEVFDQPGFGLFGVGGILAILAGVFTLSEEPFYSPDIFSAANLIALVTLLLGIVALAFISRALAKSIKSQPVSGKEGLIGKEAEVVVELTPRGRVKVGTEEWQAELSSKRQKAPKGSKTCIIELRGNTLIVDKVTKDKGGAK
jgi:membrane-bound serine protease (ClpP class)